MASQGDWHLDPRWILSHTCVVPKAGAQTASMHMPDLVEGVGVVWDVSWGATLKKDWASLGIRSGQEPGMVVTWAAVQSVSVVGDWNKIIFLCPYQCSGYQCVSRCPGCRCSKPFLFLLPIPYPPTLCYIAAWFCSTLKFPSPVLLKSFLMHFFPCFVGKTEAPTLLREAWSGVSRPSLLPKPEFTSLWALVLPACNPVWLWMPRQLLSSLCVLLWSFFSHPSCCLQSLNKSTESKCGWGLI